MIDVDNSARLRAAMSTVSKRITQRKFCTSCQAQQPFEGGSIKRMANGRVRWQCASCGAREQTVRVAGKRAGDE